MGYYRCIYAISRYSNALAPQDFLYTQITLGTDTTFRLVGAIQEILVAPENPAAVIDAVADNQTQLVTTTITEKGYCLSSGELDSQHPGIIQDLGSLEQPQTIYGYLAAAIIKRCKIMERAFSAVTICKAVATI